MTEITSVPPKTPAATVFNFRIACGLFGILIAAMVAGLNNRVAGLVFLDVQASLGFAHDAASWINTAYAAGELAAMPFAAWFAITFSMRRFHSVMLSIAIALAAVIPFIQNLNLLIAIRLMQGLCSGALIPILMMAALRFLPANIRLHGLALYALTATFSPNIALAIAAWSVDHLQDWRWAYWHVIPLGLLALALVNYGIPSTPMLLSRIRQANWLGMFIGISGLSLVVIALDQGLRHDWLYSPLIQSCLFTGIALSIIFLITEWLHPTPFIKLQLLSRRNLGLGFSIFFVLLIIMSSAVVIPSNSLMQLQHFRLEQITAIGLIVALPQLILGSVVALLLYQKWVDARYLFALGLSCIAIACYQASFITTEWMLAEFIPAEILQSIGQPLAVVSMLFLGTSVVQPLEGPFVAGIINTLRAFGTILGSSLVAEFLMLRQQQHHLMLLEHTTPALNSFPSAQLTDITNILNQQASVLATADLYRIFALTAMLLIPLVLMLQRIPAPNQTPPTPPSA